MSLDTSMTDKNIERAEGDFFFLFFLTYNIRDRQFTTWSRLPDNGQG